MTKRQLTFPTLWSVQDVANITGQSCETIRRRCRLGLIGHKTLGGQYRFSDEQVSGLLIDHPVGNKPHRVRA